MANATLHGRSKFSNVLTNILDPASAILMRPNETRAPRIARNRPIVPGRVGVESQHGPNADERLHGYPQ